MRGFTVVEPKPKHTLWRRFVRVSWGMVVAHSFLFTMKWFGLIDGRPSVEHGTVLTYLLICLVLVLHEKRRLRRVKAEEVDRALTGGTQLVGDVRCTRCGGSGFDPEAFYLDPATGAPSPDRCTQCDGFGHPL